LQSGARASGKHCGRPESNDKVLQLQCVLQCVAACCSVLQRAAGLTRVTKSCSCSVCCSVLQCLTDKNLGLQCILQCLAVRCSVLQYVAVCVALRRRVMQSSAD